MHEEEGIVELPDGGSISWEAFGPEDEAAASGPPVLLISGQAVTRESWHPVVPRLAQGRHLILFDHRGIGESAEGPTPPRTIPGFADDLRALLDGLGVDRADVIGHSMGGRSAQLLAIEHPERVRGLVLVSSSGGDAHGEQRPDDATRDLASGDPARLGPRFFSPRHLAEHPEMIRIFTRPEGTIATRRRHFEASSSHDAWDLLGRIAAPTLVIHGEADSITPVGNGRRMAREIPSADYLEIPAARHAPHLDEPAALAAIETFLDRLDAQHLA